MRRQVVLAWAVLAALAAPASAQRMPDFATIDRTDGLSHFGLDLAFVSLDPGPYDSALHIEAFGQFVANSGFGGYLALPLNKSFGDGPDEGELNGDTAIEDLDLGGLYVISGTDLSFVFRLGLVVPTASEDPGDFATNFYGAQYRVTDIAMVNPDAWYLRLAFSPLVHLRIVFFRLDLGVNIPFAEDDYRADPIGRFNLGGGVDLGPAALMLELATIADIDDDDDDDIGDEDLFTTGAITARFMGTMLQPYLTVGMPIDEDVRNTVEFFVGFGIQGVIH